MSSDHGSWLPGLLEAVETAEPVAAVRVFAEELARQINAQQVSFLIADFSGHCLIRMTQSTHQGPGQSTAEQVPLSDEHLPYRAAIIDQHVQMVVQEGGVRVLVPVSSRGDAMGLLDVTLSQEPDAAVEQLLNNAAHALALVVTSASGGHVGSPPVQAQGGRVVAQLGSNDLVDRRGEDLHELTGVQLSVRGDEPGEVNIGGVALEHAVGDQDQAVPWLQLQS